ncbi:MAG: hypothetical protein HYY00_04815 [Chloroflexi bacterium]|nr:hypothetical protein [Chloroflexota bacterium]
MAVKSVRNTKVVGSRREKVLAENKKTERRTSGTDVKVLDRAIKLVIDMHRETIKELERY